MRIKCPAVRLCPLFAILFVLIGCRAQWYRDNVDKKTAKTIARAQIEALGKAEPIEIESPADTLRRQLLLGQDLPRSDLASLGIKHLEPIDHWPKDDYLDLPPFSPLPFFTQEDSLHVTLLEALKIAAHSSREYQTEKENVFRSALSLDLERNDFRHKIFAGGDAEYTMDRTALDTPGGEVVEGLERTGTLSLMQLFKTGVSLTGQIGVDIAKILAPSGMASRSQSIFADGSISIPLLRGAGKHIVAEPLKQAERNTLYAIYDFERFKRTFAVKVASDYLSVLQRTDEIKNAEENYRGLIASGRRARRWADAGKLPEFQVDQSVQDELKARNGWVKAIQQHERSLDAFKVTLGLPADARIDLDYGELTRLAELAAKVVENDASATETKKIPAADEPIVLAEPGGGQAGQYEIGEDRAIALAFDNRLDLRVARGEIYDAQRDIVVAADRLKAELTLLGSAKVGERRALGSSSLPSSDDLRNFDPDLGFYSALLSIDLPIERTEEKIAYRDSFITLERVVRSYQALEDDIKLDMRNGLRDLLEFRESVGIQTQSVELAEKRVHSADLFLQAGLAEIRDLLEAQEALLGAQNALSSAMVNYRIAELELQRDMGLLEIDRDGLWREYVPQEAEGESSD